MVADLDAQEKFLGAMLKVTNGLYGLCVITEDLKPELSWDHNKIYCVRNYLLAKGHLTFFPGSYDSFRLSQVGYATAIGEVAMSSSSNIHISHSNITGMQVQQNTCHSSQQQNIQVTDSQSLEAILTKIAEIVRESNVSDERKQLTELSVSVIKDQLKLSEQQRNKPLISISWENISKLSDLISVVPFITDAGKKIAALLGV